MCMYKIEKKTLLYMNELLNSGLAFVPVNTVLFYNCGCWLNVRSTKNKNNEFSYVKVLRAKHSFYQVG